jgi:membrane protein implicated in regulation of membrane protease activity
VIVKRKLLILTITSAVVAVAVFHHDPLQMVANFIIGGIVPGINISIGFIPSLLIIIALLLLMKRWVRELHFQMIRRAALEMNAERTKQELETTHAPDKAERSRSVIAARSLEGGATQL